MSCVVLAPKSDLHWGRALYNVMGQIKNKPSFSLPFYETREAAEKEYVDVDIFELPLTDDNEKRIGEYPRAGYL
jgi:hypothetical protein